MTPPPAAEQAPAPVGNAIRQIALQGAAILLVLSLAWPYYGVQGTPLPWPDTAYFIGGVALLLSTLIRQPLWWRVIHAVFIPLVWLVGTLGIDPLWFLLAFVLLLLFFRSAPGSQIPLYFSNETTAAAIAELTATDSETEMRFIDLGAGIGSLARPLAAARPDARIAGVENSPAAWLIGFVAARGMRNLQWLWGNLWQTGLGEYNVAYAFLSPAPMAALWIKVKREMRPGSLFVSNSFPVPDVPPSEVFEVDDARHTRLYCYRI